MRFCEIERNIEYVKYSVALFFSKKYILKQDHRTGIFILLLQTKFLPKIFELDEFAYLRPFSNYF